MSEQYANDARSQGTDVKNISDRVARRVSQKSTRRRKYVKKHEDFSGERGSRNAADPAEQPGPISETEAARSSNGVNVARVISEKA
jgi:hypothetical protein